MVTKKSLFQFDDFFIIKFDYKFHDPGPQAELRVKSYTERYIVDFDFGFDTRDDKRILLFCKASINNIDPPIPGYSIFAEGAGVFSAELGKDLPPKVYATEIQLSAIIQGINQLRNYVMMATANGPFGRYQFPLIDMAHLMRSKAELSNTPQKPSTPK